MDAKSLGPVIKKWRIEGGLKQAELGQRAGLSKRIVGTLERGERAPEISEIVQLSRALERDPNELLTLWYRSCLQKVAELDKRPQETSTPEPPEAASKVDQIIDQMAALAKELHRESKSEYQEIFLSWLAPYISPPSPLRKERKRVGRSRGPKKA